MKFGLEPIEHRSPLKPINLTPVWPKDEEPEFITFYDAVSAAAKDIARKVEADRIWKLVVNVAEARGTGAAPDIGIPTSEAPSAPVFETSFPPDGVPPIEVVYPVVVGVYGFDDTAPSEYAAPAEDAA